MNTWRDPATGNASGGPGSYVRTIVLRNALKKASDRAVFFDYGELKSGAYFVVYDGSGQAIWYDDTWMHGNGIVLSFADSHVEYKKWNDQYHYECHTTHIPYGKSDPTKGKSDCDLRWLVYVTWGDVPWAITTTKRCDY
jgi:hypothetical protein